MTTTKWKPIKALPAAELGILPAEVTHMKAFVRAVHKSGGSPAISVNGVKHWFRQRTWEGSIRGIKGDAASFLRGVTVLAGLQKNEQRYAEDANECKTAGCLAGYIITRHKHHGGRSLRGRTHPETYGEKAMETNDALCALFAGSEISASAAARRLRRFLETGKIGRRDYRVRS